MPVIVDAREKDPILLGGADEVWLLDYERPGEPGTIYSYDILVAREHPHRELRFERKTWPDYVRSWTEGKLEGQLEAVDGLVIELDPIAIAEGAPVRNHGEAEHLWRARRHNYYQLHQSAWKHLATLAANCWVIPSEGPACTLALMRYLEANIDLKVRNNRVKGPKGSARRRILAALPGVNPDRELPDGRTVGDALETAVDWNKLADALNLAAWTRLDLGKGAKGFGLGTLSRVSDALRRPP